MNTLEIGMRNVGDDIRNLQDDELEFVSGGATQLVIDFEDIIVSSVQARPIVAGSR